RVAGRLRRLPIEAVYASTMKRAAQTAEPFATGAGHEVRLHGGVVEFDRDSGRYVPMEQLKREDYAAWQAFVARGADADIGAFQKTVVDALEEIIASHPGGTVAVFCHGGVINVWTAHVLGMAPRLFFEPGYASVHRFLCARSGQRNLVALNDVAHLDAEAG
ncbi:MAG TPA: histidine phosphatase family protein, partial [Caulobacteraceae bacterium]|nr:histidine phosphatase family protein [Caulobacteraceae bacterium]